MSEDKPVVINDVIRADCDSMPVASKLPTNMSRHVDFSRQQYSGKAGEVVRLTDHCINCCSKDTDSSTHPDSTGIQIVT